MTLSEKLSLKANAANVLSKVDEIVDKKITEFYIQPSLNSSKFSFSKTAA